MTSTGMVRCHGCGVLNGGYAPACISCGTLLRRSAAEAAPDSRPPAPLALPSPDDHHAARGDLARVRGVGRLFVTILLLWIGAMVAIKAGASEAKVDVWTSALFAAMALGCCYAAREDVAPLLSRTGGAGGLLLAVAGLGIMAAFGTVYFWAVGALGLGEVRLTDTYLQEGWPPWTAYVLVAVAPGLFEELTFRGYVMERLDRLLTPTETLLVQGALFALVHLGVVVFPSHFGIGVLLGVIRRRTRSLYPGMAVHMSWNALVVWAELAGRRFP